MRCRPLRDFYRYRRSPAPGNVGTELVCAAIDRIRRRQSGVEDIVAKLIFRSGTYAGKNMSLPAGKSIVLGRNRDVDLPLNDPKLSRRHCQITASESGCVIVDMGSTNGTFVNGNRLDAEKPQELIEFDRIILGDTEIELYLTDGGDKSLALSSDDNMPVVRPKSGAYKVSEATPNSPTQTLMRAVEDGGASPKSGSGAVPVPRDVEIVPDPDPLLAALYEIGLPLPPEPPATAQIDTVKVEVVYCHYCGEKITLADRATGAARSINNKWGCQKCLARPATAKSPPGVDSMLAGLDQEPTVVDTSKKPRLGKIERDEVERLRQDAQPAPAAKKEKSKIFGDDFEEIG